MPSPRRETHAKATRLASWVVATVALLLMGVGGGLWSAQAAGLANSPWPMFQHDPQHTGRSAFSGPSFLDREWRFQVKGIPGSPAIGEDGTIYVATGGLFVDEEAGSLYAINPEGTQQWRYQLSAPAGDDCRPIAGYTTPAIAEDGTIYVHTQPGFTASGADCTMAPNYLFAINPDGTLKWRFGLDPGFETSDLSSPAVGTDGTIYVESPDQGLYAIDAAGNELWRGAGNRMSPAIGPNGNVYTTATDLFAYEPDGTFLWAADIGSGYGGDVAPSVGSDGTVYACSDPPAACYAIGQGGNQVWSFPTPDPVVSTPPALATDGTIYVASDVEGFGLYALKANGTQAWHLSGDLNWPEPGFTVFDFDNSPVIGSDGLLYTRDDCEAVGDGLHGLLMVLDPDGSQISTELLPEWCGSSAGGELSPAIGQDGTLYVPEPQEYVDYDPNNQYVSAYVEDVTPPPAPTITGTTPSSPSGFNYPSVRGTVAAGSTVSLFKSSDCSGAPAVVGSAFDFSNTGLQVWVPDNSTTTFTANASDDAGNTSSCSNPFDYVEQSYVPPEPPPPPPGSQPAPQPEPEVTLVPGGPITLTGPKAVKAGRKARLIATSTPCGKGPDPLALYKGSKRVATATTSDAQPVVFKVRLKKKATFEVRMADQPAHGHSGAVSNPVKVKVKR